MLDREVVGSRRHAQQLLDDLLGLVDLRGEEIDRILRVQVEVGSVVSQRLHVGVAARRFVALGIGRPHVRRILADDIGNGSFVLDHLLLAHVGRDTGQAVVGPGVGGDLVTFVDHAPQQVGPGSGDVDLAFAQVVARDIEGGREAVLLEEIQELGGVDVGAVVIRQRHHVGLGATVDVGIIGHLP